MDPTLIMTPLDQLTSLFQKSLKISTGSESTSTQSNPSSQDMCEERDLAQLMKNINLDEQMHKMKPSQQNMKQGALMQSPRSIQDFCKFGWMLPLNIDTSDLMTSLGGQRNSYLSAMLRLIRGCPEQAELGFVRIYPHTDNLVAKCDIGQGQTIIQISEQFMLGNSKTYNTFLKRYVLQLSVHMLQGKPIIKATSAANFQALIDHLRKVQTFSIPVYIFEKKFVEEIANYSFSKNKIDAVQWLYFKLLPENLDYHPIKEWEAIRPFHRQIAHSLEKLQYDIIEEYKMIKQLVDGELVMDDYSFLSFLNNTVPYGSQIYEKYQRLFTPKNYVWTKLCERSRVFDLSSGECLEHKYILGDEMQIGCKKKLVPFLDLLHHSSSLNNLSWHYSADRSSIVVKAATAIKKGDLLYISYKKMPMQNCYIDYGFVDASQLSHVDLNLIISIEMIQWVASELFEKKIKKRFMNFLYGYLSEHQLVAEVRIYDYIADCYEDHLTKKELFLEEIIHAYTQMTLLLLNKLDPQFHKKLYLQKQTPMKIKMRKIIVRLIVATLQANISQRKEKIQKIEKGISKIQMFEQGSQSNTSFLGKRGKHELQNRFRMKQDQAKFNSLYHSTAVKTILATEVKILQKVLSLYSKSKSK